MTRHESLAHICCPTTYLTTTLSTVISYMKMQYNNILLDAFTLELCWLSHLLLTLVLFSWPREMFDLLELHRLFINIKILYSRLSWIVSLDISNLYNCTINIIKYWEKKKKLNTRNKCLIKISIMVILRSLYSSFDVY